jgi:hypothetical protein
MRRLWASALGLWNGIGGRAEYAPETYPVSLARFVLVLVAVDRSARAYPGPGIWGIMARAGVWMGVARMWAEAVGLYVLTTSAG